MMRPDRISKVSLSSWLIDVIHINCLRGKLVNLMLVQ